MIPFLDCEVLQIYPSAFLTQTCRKYRFLTMNTGTATTYPELSTERKKNNGDELLFVLFLTSSTTLHNCTLIVYLKTKTTFCL